MAYQDLREFLAVLQDHGQLVTVDEEVSAEPDLGAAAAAVSRLGDGAPGLLFTNVAGFRRPQIAMNLHGSWINHALALGLPPETSVQAQIEHLAKLSDEFPVDVERLDAPPFAANSRSGEDVDLFEVLPLFRLNAGDGGFYIDKAVVVSRDPDDPDHFGKQNVGIYRMEVTGRNRLGLQPNPQHDLALQLRRAEERGEDLPVAIALGNDPVLSLVAAMPIAYDQSEYEMAGALRQKPFPITSAPSTGIDVPWGCEVLLEGAVLGGVRELEGPFGEFTGHYSGSRRMPVIRVDRISFRTDPVFEHLYLGRPWTEIDYMFGPSTSLPILRELRAEYPEVVAVNAMYTHGLLAIISTRQRYGGFGKAVGMRAMTTRHGLGYCKVVIVVDEDIDPFDLPQVMWALSTKLHGAHDVAILPNLPVLPLDPGADPPGISHKVLLDATTPVAPERRGRYHMPVVPAAETDSWIARLTELHHRNGGRSVASDSASKEAL
ncbi:non-oxidative hydroxyarylic acid decarboxylases subunit C [Amycolatopsis keratiniphila]|uniref:Phenolic acid decarboxylase n=1 Tax=Amycolatopsis keratiniphila subsp. keratiniphila TaxID=227715 RepID=A0A1W2M2Y1_9PSEU|nr:non-oxidative hydroxyarylic acid decarboxylases subunit C [Amycolatopsis keratiniphila]ONF74385.1 phenolic acid decarboxylase [Amycolatopsis keratiniphila subsp. keratiniphila]